VSERFQWWEFDPTERPVPLGPDAQAVARAAESIVEAERVAIGRQDTDPTLQTLAAIESGAAGSHRPADDRHVLQSFLAPAVALLAAGCIAMFGWGWQEGARARALAPGSGANRQHLTSDEVARVTRRADIGRSARDFRKPDSSKGARR
jgi:hypothetical protein